MPKCTPGSRTVKHRWQSLHLERRWLYRKAGGTSALLLSLLLPCIGGFGTVSTDLPYMTSFQAYWG